MKSAIAVYFIVFIFLVSLDKANLADDASSKYLAKQNSQNFVSRNVTRGDNTFLLASCDRKKLSEEISCYISIMRLPYDIGSQKQTTTISSNNATLYKSCNLTSTFANDRTLNFGRFPIEFEILGHTSKALITWDERSLDFQSMHKRIAILDMSSCQAEYLDLSYWKQHPAQDVLMTNLATHGDTFEVFISDQNACKGFAKCRLLYNQWGGLVNPTPSPLHTNIFMGKTIMAHAKTSTLQSLYIVSPITREPGAPLIEYIGEDGLIKRQLLPTVSHDSKMSQLVMSTANDNFTVCGNDAGLTQCNQFDSDATKPKLDFKLEHELQNVAAVDVHNLIGGGFLLATVKCGDFVKLSCTEFMITEVKSNGSKEVLSTVTIDLSCNVDLNHLSANVHEGDGVLCFHLLCMSDGEAGSVPNSLLHCIPKISEHVNVGYFEIQIYSQIIYWPKNNFLTNFVLLMMEYFQLMVNYLNNA